jgi:hypothetical protein
LLLTGYRSQIGHCSMPTALPLQSALFTSWLYFPPIQRARSRGQAKLGLSINAPLTSDLCPLARHIFRPPSSVQIFCPWFPRAMTRKTAPGNLIRNGRAFIAIPTAIHANAKFNCRLSDRPKSESSCQRRGPGSKRSSEYSPKQRGQTGHWSGSARFQFLRRAGTQFHSPSRIRLSAHSIYLDFIGYKLRLTDQVRLFLETT